MAFRFIAADEHPDHDTIATFRRRFLNQIEALFVQGLGVAREMGVLKLGTVALDGTKIQAQLKAEVADLPGQAEAADQVDVPDGMQVPAERARREKQPAEIPSSGYSDGFAVGTLASLARAKAVIEARAKERHVRASRV